MKRQLQQQQFYQNKNKYHFQILNTKSGGKDTINNNSNQYNINKTYSHQSSYNNNAYNQNPRVPVFFIQTLKSRAPSQIINQNYQQQKHIFSKFIPSSQINNQQSKYFHHQTQQYNNKKTYYDQYQNNHYQSDRKNITSPSNLKYYQKCTLCQIASLQPLISISNCQHKFCITCLQQYVTFKVNMTQDVYCPQQHCPNKMAEDTLFFQKLPIKILQRYNKNKLWRQTINNPSLRLCPREECKQGLVDQELNPPQCRSCNTKFCKQCEMEAHSGSCQDNFKEKFKHWKSCPNCKIFIQKIFGCNHMVCTCKHQFCYVCLMPWANSHYSCRQKIQKPALRQVNIGLFIIGLLGAGIASIISVFILLIMFLIIIPFMFAIGFLTGLIALPFLQICYNSSRNNNNEKLSVRQILLWPFTLYIKFRDQNK